MKRKGNAVPVEDKERFNLLGVSLSSHNKDPDAPFATDHERPRELETFLHKIIVVLRSHPLGKYMKFALPGHSRVERPVGPLYRCETALRCGQGTGRKARPSFRANTRNNHYQGNWNTEDGRRILN